MLLLGTMFMALLVTLGGVVYARYLAPAIVIERRDLALIFVGALIAFNASVHLVMTGMNGLDAILITIGLATEYGGCRGLVRSYKEAS